MNVSHLCLGVTFGYPGQKPLFIELDFGIDMQSRGKEMMLTMIKGSLWSTASFECGNWIDD